MAKNYNSQRTVPNEQVEADAKTFEEALRRVRQNAKAAGADKLTISDIDAEVSAARQEKKMTRRDITRANERSRHRG
jgi:hypothetical protein